MARFQCLVLFTAFALSNRVTSVQILEDEYLDDMMMMTRLRHGMRRISTQHDPHRCKPRGAVCKADIECCTKHCVKTRQSDQDRIIGGEKASLGDNPSVVELQLDDWQQCGATIVNEFYVLTAAHCIDVTIDPSRYSIIAGSVRRNRGGTKYRISHVEVHQRFTTVDGAFDIAVLRTSTPILYIPKYVQPAKIPKPKQLRCAIGTVWGWGYTMDGVQVYSEYLLKVEVPRVGSKLCNGQYNGNAITIFYGWQLCYGSEGKDSCQGDSGGPLTCNDSPEYVIGIVSFGVGCGTANHSGVYTDVSKYHDWISSKTQI